MTNEQQNIILWAAIIIFFLVVIAVIIVAIAIKKETGFKPDKDIRGWNDSAIHDTDF
ncbi:MAG: hypothetical protein JWO92_2499 [Chitinophagaceae bacterium]|nr:hypothetical protein [Chitinophagaceae bacterium]